MKNQIKNIVIVAGGLNTRMEDLSVFPKVLFPLQSSDSILSHDLDVFSDKEVFLVINKKYYDMVLEYCKRNRLAVRVIKSSNCDGSANTLKEIAEMLPSKDTLLVWSDLIIKDTKMLENLLETTDNMHVVMTQSGMYRFKASEVDGKFHLTQLEQNLNSSSDFAVCGNVPGIYFYQTIPDFSVIPEDRHNYDYVEFIRDYYSQYTGTCPVGSGLIEFRDKEKFKEYYHDTVSTEENKKTRFFNDIEFDWNTMRVTKTCTNPEYTHLIQREGKWYDKVESCKFDGIPMIWRKSYWDDGSFASITMDILDGFVTASEYAETHSQTEIVEMVENIIKKADELHKDTLPVEFLDVQEDFEEEFIEKVLRRCDSIKHMLINYDRDKLEKLLTKACSILYHHKCQIGVMPNTTYSLIHGDLNGSNVMYNPDTKEVKFIDPRGYFGKTELYGPDEYDYAKILYFISGYDKFNKGRAIYNDWKFEDLLDTDKIPKKLMTWYLWIMVGIIWIALAQYIAQDVMKANLAYEYGMSILENQLENSEKE